MLILRGKSLYNFFDGVFFYPVENLIYWDVFIPIKVLRRY